MFNFGNSSPWQDGSGPTNQGLPHGEPAVSGNSLSDVSLEEGGDRAGSAEAQPKVIESQPPNLSTLQHLYIAAFIVLNLALLSLIVCLFFLLTSALARLLLLLALGSLWLSLLLFNIHLAASPRRVVQSFLHSKLKTRLSPRPRPGAVVVVRGPVSLLNEELLSTDFQKIPGLVLVDSTLRSYTHGSSKDGASTDHARQTRAVDFRITDKSTGVSAIVRAFEACENGFATTLVHTATEVPLSAVAVKDGSKGASSSKEKGDTFAPHFMVCKGYIRQGQVVTVMGAIDPDEASKELNILPLTQPYNVSKFLLYRWCIPFFFPVWVDGLVISDDREQA